MKKTELIAAIRAAAQVSGAEADTLLEELWAQLALALAREGRVTLPGLGTFVVRQRAARQQRHPRSGDLIQVPAHNTVLFRPAKALRAAIKEMHS